MLLEAFCLIKRLSQRRILVQEYIHIVLGISRPDIDLKQLVTLTKNVNQIIVFDAYLESVGDVNSSG